jgi:TPP-dependent pyruvate/acetoin dehydrogenase alpha subunit
MDKSMLDLDSKWRYFSNMLLVRRFEEELIALYKTGKFSGHFHVCIGQEATAAIAMDLLAQRDHITTTHRNHGHMLARGVSEKIALAEILGREAGMNSGYAGSFHLTAPELGFLSTSGIVGGAISLGVGGAYACKQRGDQSVTMALFGDGALEEGVSFESLNLASLWKLPLVFVCENNDATLWTPSGTLSKEHAVSDLCDLPRLCGIATKSVAGLDLNELNSTFTLAIEHCRSGAGPFFIEVKTARWPGNRTQWPEPVTGRTDLNMALGRQTIPDEDREWFEVNDPVLKIARQLANEPAGDSKLLEIDIAITRRMEVAVEFALSSPYPNARKALDHVFA